MRLGQLRGDSTAGFVVRSLSSRFALRRDGVWLIAPTIHAINNSVYPVTLNDGALWAGRGLNLSLRFGAAARVGRLRVVVAPEFARAENSDFPDVDESIWYRPPLDLSRYSSFASPWHRYPFLVDLPFRFGTQPIVTVVPGQSSVWYEGRHVAAGLSTENQWWGPGIRDAIVFTNAASGFPHAFVRTARPLRTGLGDVEARWIVGALEESPYFDLDPTNDARSIAAAGVTLRVRADTGLTLGLARSVYATADDAATAFLRPLDVLQATRRPNARPIADSTLTEDRDQIMSLFARWVFPRARAEVYGELGRAERPANLRELFVDPTHSMGYLLGGQWARRLSRVDADLRAQAELVFLERSNSYRYRPTTSFYSSRASSQGYTHRGQPLGAATGPGSSHQWLAADLVADGWQAGAFVGRWRRNADWNGGGTVYPPGTGWCEWDVTLYPGVRGGVRARGLGSIAGRIQFENRLNYLFQNNSGCPRGRFMRDVRATTFQIVVTPLARW